MNPTITVTPNDTGALTLPVITPALAIGTLGGAVIGFSLSKKHKVLGTIALSALGGWIGQAYQNSQAAKP